MERKLGLEDKSERVSSLRISLLMMIIRIFDRRRSNLSRLLLYKASSVWLFICSHRKKSFVDKEGKKELFFFRDKKINVGEKR